MQPIYPSQAQEQNSVKICLNCVDIVGNNGLELHGLKGWLSQQMLYSISSYFKSLEMLKILVRLEVVVVRGIIYWEVKKLIAYLLGTQSCVI